MRDSGTTLERMVEQGLLDAVADGLLVCDRYGRIMAVNRRTEDLSGYDATSLLGESVEFLVPAILRSRHALHRAYFLDSGQPTRPMGASLDTRLLTRSGKTLPVDIALAVLTIDDETFVVTSIRDASARVRQEESLRAMKEVTDAILKGRPAHDIYQTICEHSVALVDAAMALIALRSETGPEFEVAALAGDGVGQLDGAVLTDRFWDTAATTEGRTVTEGSFEHIRVLLDRPLGSLVLFPLPEGQRLGFLMIANEPGSAFDEDSLELLETVAHQARLAFAYGRRLRALAVADDRDRIARDMHDLVIQRLFGAGLSLQVAAQTYSENRDLSERLQEVIGSLDAAIAELRRSIFDLEKRDRLGFRERVQVVVEEVMGEADIARTVIVDGEDLTPPEEKVAHMLATLREALTNTIRHSGATRVDVTVEVGDVLVLVVEDDGSGIDGTGTPGHGLSNMAERARKLGGELETFGSESSGLTLRWRVPLDVQEDHR